MWVHGAAGFDWRIVNRPRRMNDPGAACSDFPDGLPAIGGVAAAHLRMWNFAEHTSWKVNPSSSPRTQIV